MAVFTLRFCALLFFFGCIADQFGLPPVTAAFSLLCELWSERGPGIAGRSELALMSFLCVTSFVSAEMMAVIRHYQLLRARRSSR